MEKFSITGLNLPVKTSIAAEALMEIYSQKGDLTPEMVLAEAKAKKNPLHKCFEWDDSAAAKKYRLSQARDIIRCIVVNKEIEGVVTPVRAFVNIRRDDQGKLSTNPFVRGASSYVYVDNAMSSDILSKYTLERAVTDLKHYMDKYNTLKELAPLFRVIKKKLPKIKVKVKGRVGRPKKKAA